MELRELLQNITPPDEAAREQAHRRLLAKNRQINNPEEHLCEGDSCVLDDSVTEIFGKGLIPWQSGESPAAAIRSATTSGKGGIHPEGRTASRAPGMSAAIPRKSARRS